MKKIALLVLCLGLSLALSHGHGELADSGNSTSASPNGTIDVRRPNDYLNKTFNIIMSRFFESPPVKRCYLEILFKNEILGIRFETIARDTRVPIKDHQPLDPYSCKNSTTCTNIKDNSTIQDDDHTIDGTINEDRQFSATRVSGKTGAIGLSSQNASDSEMTVRFYRP